MSDNPLTKTSHLKFIYYSRQRHRHHSLHPGPDLHSTVSNQGLTIGSLLNAHPNFKSPSGHFVSIVHVFRISYYHMQHTEYFPVEYSIRVHRQSCHKLIARDTSGFKVVDDISYSTSSLRNKSPGMVRLLPGPRSELCFITPKHLHGLDN